MIQRRAFLALLVSLVVSPSGSAQSLAQPVLIKLNLKESRDWSTAQSLGVVAYHRFEDFVLAEFERTRLEELDQAGLKYQIVDGDPWPQEYFLVTVPRVLARPAPIPYGRVLFEDQTGQLVKGSKEEAFDLLKAGFTVLPVSRQTIQLEYRPALTRPVRRPAICASHDRHGEYVYRSARMVLVDGTQAPGNKKVVWDGKNEKGQDAASGIYFYRMEAGGFAKTNQMLLLK